MAGIKPLFDAIDFFGHDNNFMFSLYGKTNITFILTMKNNISTSVKSETSTIMVKKKKIDERESDANIT